MRWFCIWGYLIGVLIGVLIVRGSCYLGVSMISEPPFTKIWVFGRLVAFG